MTVKPLYIRFLLVACCCWVQAKAQFGRVYLNAPRGSAALAATYSNTGSNTWIDESIATSQLRSKNNTTNFNYTHVLRVLDRTAGLGINIPVVSHLITWQNTKEGKVLNTDGGMADPSIIFDVNCWGGASMLPEVFRKTPMRDYFGIHTT
ncbi:hypothetical protein SAMN05444008_107188 [Cnuella takakiae]|uniref:Uncharacterized protein n=1 Tax=Cnuella takakiae TaxID=1302690 RepID=A0A1M5B7U7_9BACT|nr:hypothetical protein [Cnuella takakiae]OLY93371.1 hypothetical protein BUE76_16905 [Cnuella takakiae]SHF38621.1 hypothetical protein SAMN05444008_107188 [Cnuella takakiae]